MESTYLNIIDLSNEIIEYKAVLAANPNHK